MALFPVLLLLVTMLLPSFSAKQNKDQAIAALSTTLRKVQQEIVDKHNELRRAVSPSASDMLKMKWSSASAAKAQTWAERCNYKHSDQAFRRTNTSCGENLFMSSHSTIWSKVIQSWFDEYQDFVYGVGPKTPTAVIGHYTQLVWSTSFRVGCGFAYCPNNYLKFFMVCHYCPAGNYVSRLYTPYTKGTPCSSCPDHCDDGLCTNNCDYEDLYSNCGNLKNALTCANPTIKNSCKASCNCQDKIH